MNNHIVGKPIYLWMIVLLTVPLLDACQKDRLPDEVKTAEDAYRTIFGEWEWEKTIIYDRGQEGPIYQTPETENKTVERAFMKNLKSYRVETIDKVGSRTDYRYIVTVDMPGGDDYSWTFVLKSVDANTKEEHFSAFRFKTKDTVVFFPIYPPAVDYISTFESYYTRK